MPLLANLALPNPRRIRVSEAVANRHNQGHGVEDVNENNSEDEDKNDDGGNSEDENEDDDGEDSKDKDKCESANEDEDDNDEHESTNGDDNEECESTEDTNEDDEHESTNEDANEDGEDSNSSNGKTMDVTSNAKVSSAKDNTAGEGSAEDGEMPIDHQDEDHRVNEGLNVHITMRQGHQPHRLGPPRSPSPNPFLGGESFSLEHMSITPSQSPTHPHPVSLSPSQGLDPDKLMHGASRMTGATIRGKAIGRNFNWADSGMFF